jgi:hypothetical protein
MAATPRPVHARKKGAAVPDWDATLRRALEAAHQDALKETERLRRLGIIDENGNLLRRTRSSGTRSGDFGGWG